MSLCQRRSNQNDPRSRPKTQIKRERTQMRREVDRRIDQLTSELDLSQFEGLYSTRLAQKTEKDDDDEPNRDEGKRLVSHVNPDLFQPRHHPLPNGRVLATHPSLSNTPVSQLYKWRGTEFGMVKFCKGLKKRFHNTARLRAGIRIRKTCMVLSASGSHWLPGGWLNP